MPEDYKAKLHEYKADLQKLLRKLFQFDVADLDFGIYRIMNQKRDKIEKFIEKDIIETVDIEFERYETANKEEIQKELKEIEKNIENTIGTDAIKPSGEIKEEYKTLPIAKEYYKKKEELKNAEITDQQKAEIFSHIYQFFSRYYHDGDFLSLRRRSKQNKYAIPYNGEEVVLHWANKDQYYIKTGEYFRNYSFNVGDYKVNFRLSNAEIEQNNNKSDRRYFVLKEGEGNIVFDGEKKELTIPFEYRELNDEEKKGYGKQKIQENIIDFVKNIILDGITEVGLKNALERIKDDSKKTLLEKHLTTYTKRNTTDYFIHKDLKGFLEKELDFYIKNEVLMLDDLGSENEVSIEKYITRIKVIKAISQKIIEFLAQIEDFQKRLFKKKKFVVKTDYCMTLDKVPEEFYEEITPNVAQINEWKVLFKLDEIEKRSLNYTANNGLKIDVDYLESNPFLVLDTKFFSQGFKDRLLASFEDLDEAIGGVMIKSENWQALNLLQEKYWERVKCIYIDPPYNTGSDEFVYKDNYQHSSWLAMMADRIDLARKILSHNGVIFTSIDDHEISSLRLLLDSFFGSANFISTLAIVNNFSGRSDRKNIATSHEHMLLYKKVDFEACGLPLPEKYRREYREKDDFGPFRYQGLRKRGSGARREDRPKLWYPFYYDQSSGKLSLDAFKGSIKILPKLSDGSDGRWRWEPQTSMERTNELVVKKVSTREEYDIFQKDYLLKNGIEKRAKAKSIWFESSYSSDFATTAYKKIMGSIPFQNPKSPDLIKDIVGISSNNSNIILDYFAGSGTTAQAVLNLNNEDDGDRRYILFEMGDYFDIVMKPRIQKVVFSSDWKDGKPTSTEGISHMFKYQYLEQYEDTLNNIEFMDSGTVQKTLEDLEGYFIKYMLDFETRDSLTRLNVDKLSRPFEYKLKITNENETREEVVDLVETFNYLLGLHVKQIRTFKNNGTDYRVVFGEKNNGLIVVIWRNTDDLDLKADKEFIKENVLKDFEAGKVYVNGNSYLENALPIEPEFKRCMGG